MFRRNPNRAPGGPVATSSGCTDCGGPTDLYALEDDVWFKQARARSDTNLCIPCLERRLRRRLTAADFNWGLCNDPNDRSFPKSRLLLDRLRGWTPS